MKPDGQVRQPHDEPAVSPTKLADERRAHERIPHRTVLVMPYGEGVESRFERATLTDCSVGGIGILVGRPFAPRSRFFVKLKLTGVALIVYEVKYCQRQGNGFHVGAAFHDVIGQDADRTTTPEQVLAALLAE